MTGSVSIIPIILMVLLRQARLMRSFSRQANELDRQLPVRMGGISQEEGISGEMAPEEGVDRKAEETGEVEFRSENGQDSIHLPVNDFLYAEAADNYVKVFYLGGHKIIRSSLKRLEDDVRAYEQIFRCHRTYLVNLDKVIHISGNAQGYKLHLEGTELLIPVSRSLNGEVTRLVTRPKAPSIHPSDL
jgi:DNA-binding LytR/AlgR family response regulator